MGIKRRQRQPPHLCVHSVRPTMQHFLSYRWCFENHRNELDFWLMMLYPISFCMNKKRNFFIILFNLHVKNCIESNRGIYKADENGSHIMKVHTCIVTSKETSAMNRSPWYTTWHIMKNCKLVKIYGRKGGICSPLFTLFKFWLILYQGQITQKWFTKSNIVYKVFRRFIFWSTMFYIIIYL